MRHLADLCSSLGGRGGAGDEGVLICIAAGDLPVADDVSTDAKLKTIGPILNGTAHDALVPG